jgi:hypothetical protein
MFDTEFIDKFMTGRHKNFTRHFTVIFKIFCSVAVILSSIVMKKDLPKSGGT